MQKNWQSAHYLLDDHRAITTTAKAGSTSLSIALEDRPKLTMQECIKRGLEIILIIRNPWVRLQSAYHGFAESTIEEYIDRVLSVPNIHWSPQTVQHPVFTRAVKLEYINDWWPLDKDFPIMNMQRTRFTTDYRRDDLAQFFAPDLEVWRGAYGG